MSSNRLASLQLSTVFKRMAQTAIAAGALVAVLCVGENFLLNGTPAYARIEASKPLLQAESLRERYLIERGYSYMTSGNYGYAIHALDKAIESNPLSADAYFLRSQVHMVLDKYREALSDCDMTIQLRPDHVAAYLARAIIHKELHAFDCAWTDINRHIEMNPKDLQAYILRGLISVNLNKPDAAAKDFAHVVDKNPKDTDALHYLGISYHRGGDYSRAVSTFSKAIEIDQNFAPAYYSRAIAYYSQALYAEAIEEFKRSMDLGRYPGYAAIWMVLSARRLGMPEYGGYVDDLRKRFPQVNKKSWPRAFAEHLLAPESVTEDQVLSAAADAKDTYEANGQLCEAYYFLGEQRLWRGDRKGAEDFFRKSIETKAYDYYEYDMAKAMLKVMECGKN